MRLFVEAFSPFRTFSALWALRTFGPVGAFCTIRAIRFYFWSRITWFVRTFLARWSVVCAGVIVLVRPALLSVTSFIAIICTTVPILAGAITTATTAMMVAGTTTAAVTAAAED